MTYTYYALQAAARLFITVVSFGSAFAMLWLNILNVLPRLPLGEFVFCMIIGVLLYPRLVITCGECDGGKTEESSSRGSVPPSEA